MNQNNEMTELTGRASRLIDTISGAILATVEVAADRLALAAEVARVAQRMAAFGAVLDVVGVQKEALAARMVTAKGPMRTLLGKQIEMLTAQEAAILAKSGVPAEVAAVALAAVDGGANADAGTGVGKGGGQPALSHRRIGRRFVPAARVGGVDEAGAGDTHGGNGAAG